LVLDNLITHLPLLVEDDMQPVTILALDSNKENVGTSNILATSDIFQGMY